LSFVIAFCIGRPLATTRPDHVAASRNRLVPCFGRWSTGHHAGWSKRAGFTAKGSPRVARDRKRRPNGVRCRHQHISPQPVNFMVSQVEASQPSERFYMTCLFLAAIAG